MRASLRITPAGSIACLIVFLIGCVWIGSAACDRSNSSESPKPGPVRSLRGEFERVRDYALTPWFLRDPEDADTALPDILSEARTAILTRPVSQLELDVPPSESVQQLHMGVRRRATVLGEAAQAAAVVCDVFLAGPEPTLLGSQRLARPAARETSWSTIRFELPGGGVRKLLLTTRLDPHQEGPNPEVVWSLPGFFDPRQASKPDVLLLTVDTFRADALAHAPALSETLKRGVLWPRAVSPSNWTLPAYGSLFTGLEPEVHGAGRGVFQAQAGGQREDRAFQGLDPQSATLAEQFRDAGYATAMIHQNPFLEVWTGMDRGFDRYVRTRENTRVGLQLAEDWWRQHRHRPRFLVLHLMAPHLPYAPPKGDLEQPLPKDPLKERDWRSFFSTDRTPEERERFFDLPADQREDVATRYFAEIRAMDRALRPWLERMLAGERPPLFAFHSDHGEELWDQGSFEHGHAFCDAVIRVPVALVWPEHLEARRIDEAVPAHALHHSLLRLAEVGRVPAEYDDLFRTSEVARSSRPLYRSRHGGVEIDRTGQGSRKLSPFDPNEGVRNSSPTSLAPELQRALAELGYAAAPSESGD